MARAQAEQHDVVVVVDEPRHGRAAFEIDRARAARSSASRFVPTSAKRSPTMRTDSTTVSAAFIVWIWPFVTSTSRTAGQGCDGGCGAGCANAGATTSRAPTERAATVFSSTRPDPPAMASSSETLCGYFRLSSRCRESWHHARWNGQARLQDSRRRPVRPRGLRRRATRRLDRVARASRDRLPDSAAGEPRCRASATPRAGRGRARLRLAPRHRLSAGFAARARCARRVAAARLLEDVATATLDHARASARALFQRRRRPRNGASGRHRDRRARREAGRGVLYLGDDRQRAAAATPRRLPRVSLLARDAGRAGILCAQRSDGCRRADAAVARQRNREPCDTARGAMGRLVRDRRRRRERPPRQCAPRRQSSNGAAAARPRGSGRSAGGVCPPTI